MSQLAFRVAQRPYQEFGKTYKTERNYIDFEVDGRSLGEYLKGRGFDLVSVLSKEDPPGERQKTVQRLLVQALADFPDDRSTLYVCAECGDIGCGAITLVIEQKDDSYVWRDFGFQNNYEPEISREHFDALGPFDFEKCHYEAVISRALQIIEGHDEG